MSESMTSGQRKQLERLFEDGGRWALDLVEKELTLEEAQRVLERGNELRADFPERIRVLARGRYANEEVPSSLVYPSEFNGLMPVREQVEALLRFFPNLDATWALARGQAWYDGLKPQLPDWIEGAMVYVRWQSLAGTYGEALEKVFTKIAETRAFYNYRQGQLNHEHLRQSDLTKNMEGRLRAIQAGDCLIVPSQVGLRHRGKSMRRAREVFISGEFGHGSVAIGCMSLTHPARFVRWEQLHVDCAGDEFSANADGVFTGSPNLGFGDSRLEFSTSDVDRPSDFFGAVSAFLPQEIVS